MNSGKLKKLLFLGLIVLLLGSSSFTQRRLNVERGRLGLTRVTPLENAPPLLAFTSVALGGFRGLIANLLWIRANDLQQDEKFFEAVQLADWITKLQPHLVTVWVHQAWNMSYNISVKFPDNRDRWPWVRRSLELLRDEGIPLNPKDALLYRELAWIYQHKMGANLDNAHVFYKYSWSEEMVKVIGEKPNWDELLNPKTDEAKARVKTLREKYKLDPQEMKKVDERFGPLEWRMPETHAIYWAVVGLEKSNPKDLITLRRVVYQSLDLASKRGRMIPNRADGQIEFGPNLNAIPKANLAYEEMFRDDPEYRENIQNGHRNFLKNAIASYYTHNREADAAKLFAYAIQRYPGGVAHLGQDLDTFVLEYITEEAAEGGVDKARSIIEGFLERSYYDLAIDEDDQAVSYERMARKLWIRHEEKVRRADRGRVDLPPYEDIKKDILNRIVTLQMPAWSEPLVLMLCTKLGLPAPKPVAQKPLVAGGSLAPLDNTPVPERNKKAGEKFLAQNRLRAGVTTRPSGLQYKVIVDGTGRQPSGSDTVVVNYEGRLISGAVFDGSAKQGKPLEFKVGNVIPGWIEALQLMRVGSKWELYIPSNLAYGETGKGPIEPNSVLIFDVELLEIKGKQ